MQVRESTLRRGTTAILTVVSIVSFALDLSRLPTWDEAIYSNVARNVIGGRWLLPQFTLQSHPLPVLDPFLQKPLLALGIQAGATRVHEHEFHVAPPVLDTVH